MNGKYCEVSTELPTTHSQTCEVIPLQSEGVIDCVALYAHYGMCPEGIRTSPLSEYAIQSDVRDDVS